jgi:hypothetical protein
MAMSSGDSIFVSAHLLVDPAETGSLGPSSISRIRGNVGKPGIAMLIPPLDPQVKPKESTNWEIINHAPFDGTLTDSFRGTSLHFSFTDYSRAIDTGVHGLKDAEIYFLEGLVSVHDGEKWIGDLDVIAALENQYFHIHEPKVTCGHTAPNLRAFRMVSIDNWNEFLDHPNSVSIIRAKDNWLARLAFSTLSVKRKHQTIVLSHEGIICWPCIRDEYDLGPRSRDFAVIC